LAAIGVGVEIVAGRGPVIDHPFRSAADLQRLRPLEPELDTPYVIETVKNLVAELDVPLIGFAGAPFTVASYLVEGGPSREFTYTKVLMHTEPALWHALMERLADLAIASLRSQIDAGASVVQLFDSWAGALTREEYIRFVRPSTTRVFAAIADLGVPRIHFGVGTGELLDLMAVPDAEVVGVDWRVPLDRARARVGPGHAVQGNLDPAICLAGFDLAAAEARQVLECAGVAGGHIFNLGHGVLPATDPDVLTRLVEFVHEESSQRRAGERAGSNP
jgi:uroporphyrinogen decarboxylase